MAMLFVAALASLPACALTSKSEALDVRWFTPEAGRAHLTGAPASPEAIPVRPALRLGRVTSGSHLREKMVRRTSAGEVEFDDAHRWTEKPEVFVRRELERELFEERGFRREIMSAAPVLDVEVLAFEELQIPNAPAARVSLRMVLQDGERVLDEETLTVDRVVGGRHRVEDVVAATSEALDGAAAAIADRIAARLAPPKAPDSP